MEPHGSSNTAPVGFRRLQSFRDIAKMLSEHEKELILDIMKLVRNAWFHAFGNMPRLRPQIREERQGQAQRACQQFTSQLAAK